MMVKFRLEFAHYCVGINVYILISSIACVLYF